MARVLLVAEQEPASSRVVARLAIEAAGHTVDEVYDGMSALAQADAIRPDVLVVDTSLPELDGFQVLDRLRRHHALRHLPVVMLSTIPKGLGGELAHSMGAIRFLPKPFTAVDLGEAIDAAVANQPPAEWQERPAVPDAASLIELVAPPRRRTTTRRRPRRGA